MADLRALLDVPADEVKKPPAWPVGTYHGFIEKYEPGETREKKTPFVRVFVKCNRADESIADFPAEIDVTKRTFRTDLYLMEDRSQHWRLKALLENLGIATEGQNMGALLPGIIGKPVRFEVTQRANQDNTDLFNEIVSPMGSAPQIFLDE